MATILERKILQKLDEWERRDGALPETVEHYRLLLRIQIEVGSKIAESLPSPPEQTAVSQLALGRPLLGFDDLQLDAAAFRQVLTRVTDIMVSDSDAARISPELEGLSSIALMTLVKRWYEADHVHPEAGDANTKLLAPVIREAAKPFLCRYREAWLPLVDHELWRRPSCPICGGSPDFGCLNSAGTRSLLCSRCDADWLFQRLQCPWCETNDPRKLAYFGDEEGTYRLYVCENCHRYLKVIDSRQAKEEVLLPLERVLTVDLDRQARSLGYSAAS